ncbi:MAG: glutathione-regulated potassium-efflux system oxidoreductase KefF [Polyangiaceae bacterium]
MILVVFAHPYPDRSRANRAAIGAVRDLPGLEVRSLYDLYPDFAIDVEVEQEALLRADVVVWQHPMYWYSVPALLKHWFDKVLSRGWAYGEGGTALCGKRCLWVTSTGAGAEAFTAAGMHAFPFESFVPAVQQTARFCGMVWEEPLVLHAAHHVSGTDLDAHVQQYRERLQALAAGIDAGSGARPYRERAEGA